jgi:hypothetical protein
MIIPHVKIIRLGFGKFIQYGLQSFFDKFKCIHVPIYMKCT